MPEYLHVCQDKVLPKNLAINQHTFINNGREEAVFVFKKGWINGSTLHVRFMGGTPAQHAIAKEQAQWWTTKAKANLKFDFGNAPNAQIRVAFDPNDGAWSYIGTDASSIPADQPTMNLGFLDGGTAAHEFGHAIGLGHEHQNPEGGLEWNEEAVIRDLSAPPNSWTLQQIKHNVFDKYRADQIRGTKFDPDSIMLYFFPDAWVKNGRGTKQNNSLSAQDMEFIAGARAYPHIAVQALELGVNAAPIPANIGAPSEEDVFKLTVTSGGRHVIETGRQTDVVMKLFGPESQTSLIAEDDDGGVGLNSRIVADMIPGHYFVSVRHFNKANGTGTYSIRAMR